MIPMNFMKSKAGFTLVELIVVIAILGILAGIAVPAYSGYIKKANTAADTQVLSAANTALASAMTENGKDPADAKNFVAADVAEEQTAVDGCTVTLTAKTGLSTEDNAIATAVIADFATYYGNSGSIVFKYFNTASISDNGTFAAS